VIAQQKLDHSDLHFTGQNRLQKEGGGEGIFKATEPHSQLDACYGHRRHHQLYFSVHSYSYNV